jgi:hypothetical protein
VTEIVSIRSSHYDGANFASISLSNCQADFRPVRTIDVISTALGPWLSVLEAAHLSRVRIKPGLSRRTCTTLLLSCQAFYGAVLRTLLLFVGLSSRYGFTLSHRATVHQLEIGTGCRVRLDTSIPPLRTLGYASSMYMDFGCEYRRFSLHGLLVLAQHFGSLWASQVLYLYVLYKSWTSATSASQVASDGDLHIAAYNPSNLFIRYVMSASCERESSRNRCWAGWWGYHPSDWRQALNNLLQGRFGTTANLTWDYTRSGPEHAVSWTAKACCAYLLILGHLGELIIFYVE